MRRTIGLVTVALVLAGCASSAPASVPNAVGSGSPESRTPDPAASPSVSSSTGPSPSAPTGGPSGVIAMGHSGLTGEGTGGTAMAENSWATGTSPDVKSVYLRLQDARPDIAGRAANVAHGSASASELPGMARQALSIVPTPALAIIQTIDSDIRCDGTDEEHVPEVGGSVAEALDLITTASPDVKVLVVGQLGRPSIPFVEELIAHDPSVVGPLKEGGMCAFLDADGQPIQANFDYLTGIIDAYEAEQARVCAAVSQCRTDGGVRAAYVDTLENFSPDYNHLNLKGQAAEAELIWPVVSEMFAP